MSKKILVIGANGFAGRRILQDLSSHSGYMLTGSSLRSDILPEKSYKFIQTDIRNEKALSELFYAVQPNVVINTSALSVPDYCETHHDEAYEMNVTAVTRIAELSEQYSARFIHLSTDFVFDGKENRLYTENDIPLPLNYYGVTKLQGEQTVAANCSDWAVVRVVVLYGKSYPGQHGNIFKLVQDRLNNNQEIRVVSDQWRTPTYIGDVSDGISKLIDHPLNGIYHICGKEYVSIADIAYRVADFLQLDSSLIIPVTTEEMQEATPRPRFSGLSIKKAVRELGYVPLSIEDGMKLTFLNV